MDINMYTKDLTNDAKAILLLCGRFGKNDAAKPLSLRERVNKMRFGINIHNSP